MRKHPDNVISRVSIPQINLDIGTALPRAMTALGSTGFAPDHQKYLVDDINKPTPCTLLYVKGRMLRTIEVVDIVVIATRIMHGRPIPSECAVVEVTMIKEGHEFEDLDYPDEEEGIEKLKSAKGDFIPRPCKNIIIKTHSSSIVSLQNREDDGTPTSQNTLRSTTRFTPPSHNPPQTTPPPKYPPSTQPLQHHSAPYVHFLKSPPHTTPPPQNPPTEQAPQHRSPPHVHSSKSPPHTSPPSLQILPTKQALQHHSPPHVHSPKFFPHTTPPSHSLPCVSSPMSHPYTTPPPQNPPMALKNQDAIVDEPSTNPEDIVENFYAGLKNYKHKKPLEDIPGMTVKEFL
jgi:hypothetical protein